MRRLTFPDQQQTQQALYKTNASAIILLFDPCYCHSPGCVRRFFNLITLALFLLFIASQVFWIGRIVDLGKWLFPDQPRVRLVVIADLVYLFVIAYSFPTTIGQGHTFRTATTGFLTSYSKRFSGGGS